jgi:GntR family transcriptional regulator, transcriptional repressor for pyruvate dehydrogenase complex
VRSKLTVGGADGNAKSRIVLERARLALRSLLFNNPPGAYLGSEPEIMGKLGISQPTFRQIARLLEQEQLLEIRRGNQGGLYVRRPNLSTVVETASLLLHFEEATVRDLLITSNILSSEAARYSAGAPAELKCELFGELLKRSRSATPQTIEDFKRDEWLMMDCLARASANKVLSLFLHTAQHVSMVRHAEEASLDEAGMSDRKQLRLRIIEAILTGDGDVAHLLSRRRLPLTLGSIPEAILLRKIVFADRLSASDLVLEAGHPSPPR